ncbi:MAG TPA: hypothetical protein VII98_13365 [Solirubrobacteraceae bacterium]
MRGPQRVVVVAVAVLALACAVPGASAATIPATPIQATGPAPTVAQYVGAPWKARPVAGVTPAWQHPLMAANPKNGVHNDAWQSDDYTELSGPLGLRPHVFSAGFGRTCITLTFDRRGRLIGSCTNLGDGPALYLLDPVTLDTLAFLQLPFVPPPAGTNPALNTTGGAYFYLDDRDRVVVASSDRRILVIGEDDSGAAPAFRQVASYDPTPCLQPDERMPSTLPDTQGRYWFVGRTKGTVGVLDPKTGKCGSIVLNEEIENSFAVASDGIYIVSDRAQYKFTAGADLKPKVVWKATYRNSGVQKPGQINAGSGTTPTLLWPTSGRRGKGTAPAYVAITDNADPMDVVVYRAGALARGQKRLVCTVPVFAKGASDTENSLIAMGRSLIVENNYGYDLVRWNDVIGGGLQIGGDLNQVSSPGMTRIDIGPGGTGCSVRWRNTTVRAPSVVSKGDAANGLIYTFENVKDPSGADPWYWTAIDYRSGKVAWKQQAGHGGLYNNHYAGIAIGSNPKTKRTTLYLGGVGGVMALRDG